MNSFIALSGIGSAAIDSCLDSKLLQPLFIDSTKTQFVHPSHNSPTTDAPLNQFIDLVVDQIENWTFWNKSNFILNRSSQEVNACPPFPAHFYARRLKLDWLQIRSTASIATHSIALRAAFTTFVATSYCAGKCSHSEVVTKYSNNARLAPITAYQRRQCTIPVYLCTQGNWVWHIESTRLWRWPYSIRVEPFKHDGANTRHSCAHGDFNPLLAWQH